MLKHRDLKTSIILLAFSFGALALTFGFAEVPAILAQGMQPSAMPRLLISLLVLLSLLLILQGWRHKEKDRRPVGWQVWATIAVMIATVMGFNSLGGLAMLSMAIFAIPLLWGERSLARVIALAIGGPAAIYLIFTMLLQLRLPPGLIAHLI